MGSGDPRIFWFLQLNYLVSLMPCKMYEFVVWVHVGFALLVLSSGRNNDQEHVDFAFDLCVEKMTN